MSNDLVPAPDPVPGVSLRTVRLSELPDVEAVDEASDPATALEVTLEPDAPRAGGRGAVPPVEPAGEAGGEGGGDTVTVLQPE